MGLRTYAMEKAGEGEQAHVRRRRYLNVGLDSHSRLFGDAEDGGTFRTKPNYMKSDILGTGVGAESTLYEKRANDSFTSEHEHQADEPDSNGNGSIDHEQEAETGTEITDEQQSTLGEGETETDAGSVVAEGDTSVNTSLNASAELETSTPARNAASARDESGNPVTGSGYREVSMDNPHRRRQFGNRQNVRSGFW